MLMGAHPSDTMDRNMQVTVAFNKFGPGLIQRLPRLEIITVVTILLFSVSICSLFSMRTD
jgi:hypothetical protein